MTGGRQQTGTMIEAEEATETFPPTNRPLLFAASGPAINRIATGRGSLSAWNAVLVPE